MNTEELQIEREKVSVEYSKLLVETTRSISEVRWRRLYTDYMGLAVGVAGTSLIFTIFTFFK